MKKFIILIALTYSSIAFSDQPKISHEKQETIEIPVSTLYDLNRVSNLFVHESHQNMLNRAEELQVLFLAANDENPEVLKTILRLKLESIKSDLDFIVNSEQASDLQRKRAGLLKKEILDASKGR